MIVFNEEKVKYEQLNNLLSDTLSNIKYESNVNVIVDLKEVFKKVFRPNSRPESSSFSKLAEEISSDIIGIVSHYRNYFFKNGKYSTFYFLYSNSECENIKKIFSNYKSEHYEKYYRDKDELINIKNKVLKILNKFLNVIPNVNFIDCSEFDDISVLKFLKNKIPNNQFTLLLTNDEHWFQCLDSNNFFAINCKGIKSSLIHESTALEYITKDSDIEISSKLLPFILAISGSKKYSISNIKGIGITRAINIINGLREKGKILDTDYLNFPLKKEDLDQNNKNEKLLYDNFESLKLNYEIISCTNLLYSNENKISELFTKGKPKITSNQLMDVCAKFFATFPINIDMLLKGEKL